MTELSCHCEGAERPWQSQGSEAETCNKKTESNAKCLELNGITTSCAVHTPRNDKNNVGRHYYADSKAKRIAIMPKTNYNPNMMNYKSRSKNESEAHSKELNVLTSYRLNDFKKKAAFTLAEGATHVDMSDNIRRVAFTLAEVLITLGIIGIVAAMTIPTLIANYQKKQTVTKLKQTYSIISQALTMAQAEHGDTTTWDVGGIYGTATNDPNFNHEDAVTKFATKYFIPYLKVSKDFGYTTFPKIDYDGHYAPGTGVIAGSSDAPGYILLLSSNVLIRVGIGTLCNESDPDTGVCIDREYRDIIFKVDINGFDKPNVSGKDVFNMAFDLQKKVFGFYNYGSSTRQNVLNKCKTDEDSQICGYLIFLDGWEIKDDYPWF